MPELNPRQRAWVEVSPAAIEANARLLLNQLSPGCQLMAVVKGWQLVVAGNWLRTLILVCKSVPTGSTRKSHQ